MSSTFSWGRIGLAVLVLGATPVAPTVVAASPGAFPLSGDESALEEAQRLFVTGRYRECLEKSVAAVVAEPDDEDWQRLRVGSHLRLGQYDEAREAVTEALLENRSSLHLIWLAREVLLRCGEDELAEAALVEFQRQERAGWRYRSAEHLVVRGRAHLAIDEDAKHILDDYYDAAKLKDPNHVEAYLATAELALDKHDDAMAADELTKALRLAPTEPQVHYLMSRAFGDSDPMQAATSLRMALEANPNHVDALLLSVDRQVAAEGYDEAEGVLQRILEIDPHLWEAWAYRSVLAHLAGDFARESECRDKAFERWATNPGVDHLIGRELSEKYRFAEGATYQRRALAHDDDHLPARFQLAQDLLRLGEEEEGWDQAKKVRKADGYNVVAYNLMVLHDVLRGYRTLERDGFIVRMDAREAEVYGENVLRLLSEAKAELTARYAVQPDAPTVVEIFAEQKDFAIRTFGLPGGAGFLGVCFGDVITMQSPATPGKSPSSWEATLWHEYAHVITLAKTENRMPRWLSEGISVYEETRRDPSWGRPMSPVYRQMILDGSAHRLSRLSRAFLEPHPQLGLSFAYFESALAVEYIVESHGFDALLALLDALGDGQPIEAALAEHLAPLGPLDRGFEAFLRDRARAFGKEATWEAVETIGTKDLGVYIDGHPTSVEAHLRLAIELLEEGREEEAVAPLERVVELCPEDPRPYPFLSELWKRAGNRERELDVRRRWAAQDADELANRERLMELAEDGEDWTTLRAVASSSIAIQPMLAGAHRRLARAALALDDARSLMEASMALLALDPVDPAEAHFRIAQAARDLGELDKAKRHALRALEEAPRYRAAQQFLLELVEDSPKEAAKK